MAIDLDKYKGHTPGDWELNAYSNYIGFSIFGHGIGCVAERWYPAELSESDNEQMEANSALIAAAPMLLAKLQEAVGLLELVKDTPTGIDIGIPAFLSTIEGA